MRAIEIREHGGIEKLELVERDEPRAGPGEVVVEMAALGLNHLDVWVRRGVPGHPFPLPMVPVSDGSGVVVEVGDGVTAAAGAGARASRGIAVGDEVFVLPGRSSPIGAEVLAGKDHLDPSYRILGEACDGLAAERVALPATNVAKKPSSLSFVEAASFGLTFLTAWNMVVRRARVEAGETVLVQAGASGVGVAAIQIAKLHGARVLATAGSAAKCSALDDLGVDRAIDYSETDVVAAVREELGPDRGGVDVVIDHVGAETFPTSMRCLARAGRYVTCGATTGPKVELMLNHVFFKNLSILGSTMGRRGDLLRVAGLIEQGQLRPVVGRVLSGLEQIGAGHDVLESRSVVGKVVVEL